MKIEYDLMLKPNRTSDASKKDISPNILTNSTPYSIITPISIKVLVRSHLQSDFHHFAY
jgi:hypothetical protein